MSIDVQYTGGRQVVLWVNFRQSRILLLACNAGQAGESSSTHCRPAMRAGILPGRFLLPSLTWCRDRMPPDGTSAAAATCDCVRCFCAAAGRSPWWKGGSLDSAASAAAAAAAAAAPLRPERRTAMHPPAAAARAGSTIRRPNPPRSRERQLKRHTRRAWRRCTPP